MTDRQIALNQDPLARNRLLDSALKPWNPPASREGTALSSAITALFGQVLEDWVPKPGSSFDGEDFRGLPMKRAWLKDCQMRACDFSQVGALGSRWNGCAIESPEVRNANFQHSYFNHCRIISESPERCFESSNLSFTSWHDCEIGDIGIRGCGFSNADFTNCTIRNVDAMSTSFDGTRFRNCSINNICLFNNNIEYIEFIDCTFERVFISAFQLFYTFGISLDDLSDGKIIITRNQKEGDAAEPVTRPELEALGGEIQSFFESRRLHFPLANFLLFMGARSEFVSAARTGIIEYLEQGRVREIKYLTKLCQISGCFSALEMDRIHTLIGDTLDNSHKDLSSVPANLVHRGELDFYLSAPATKETVLVSYNAHALPGHSMLAENAEESARLLIEGLRDCGFLFEVARISVRRFNPAKVQIWIQEITIASAGATPESTGQSMQNALSVLASILSIIACAHGLAPVDQGNADNKRPHVRQLELAETAGKAIQAIVRVEDFHVQSNGRLILATDADGNTRMDPKAIEHNPASDKDVKGAKGDQ